MATSPLGAALLGGNDNNAAAFGMDPSVMQAMPDIQLGQSLEQGSLSTAPAAPAQAAARLAQALAGTYVKSRAMSDLGRAYANTAGNLADVIEKTQPGSPLPPMLRSQDPGVRMMGFQLAQKVVPLQSELQKTGEGQQVSTGPTQVYSNTNPLSGPGKEIADAAHFQASGNQPAANAITAGVNKNAYTPEGVAVPSIPLKTGQTPQPSAAIPPPQPSPQPTADQMTDAKGQLAKKLTNVAQSGVTAPTPTGLVGEIAGAKGAQAQAEEAGKANVEYGSFRGGQGPQSGPGISEPMTTDHGTKIPPVNAQATVPSDPGVLKEKLPAWQKTVTDWTGSIAPAQLAQQRLSTIANAFKSLQSGSFTTQKADLAAALKAVGLDASGILGDPAQAQLALHENYAETMSQLKAATSRFTQQEFRITSENKEHPNIQPAANLQMLSEDMGTLQQQQDLANDWSRANKNGWKDPQSYETEFLKLNKLPDYVARAKQQIGPLKGMPGAQAPAATIASPHSPAEIQAELRRRGLIQ